MGEGGPEPPHGYVLALPRIRTGERRTSTKRVANKIRLTEGQSCTICRSDNRVARVGLPFRCARKSLQHAVKFLFIFCFSTGVRPRGTRPAKLTASGLVSQRTIIKCLPQTVNHFCVRWLLSLRDYTALGRRWIQWTVPPPQPRTFSMDNRERARTMLSVR
jgi:hypothetical protein